MTHPILLSRDSTMVVGLFDTATAQTLPFRSSGRDSFSEGPFLSASHLLASVEGGVSRGLMTGEYLRGDPEGDGIARASVGGALVGLIALALLAKFAIDILDAFMEVAPGLLVLGAVGLGILLLCRACTSEL